jgi:hypothetical protein
MLLVVLISGPICGRTMVLLGLVSIRLLVSRVWSLCTSAMAIMVVAYRLELSSDVRERWLDGGALWAQCTV